MSGVWVLPSHALFYVPNPGSGAHEEQLYQIASIIVTLQSKVLTQGVTIQNLEIELQAVTAYKKRHSAPQHIRQQHASCILAIPSSLPITNFRFMASDTTHQ